MIKINSKSELLPSMHGAKVTCILPLIISGENNKIVEDGKICYENGNYYVCQNIVAGAYCDNKLGYKYSWAIGEGKLDDELIEYHNMKLKFLTQSQRLNL